MFVCLFVCLFFCLFVLHGHDAQNIKKQQNKYARRPTVIVCCCDMLHLLINKFNTSSYSTIINDEHFHCHQARRLTLSFEQPCLHAF